MVQPSEAVRRLSRGQRARQLSAKPKDLIDLSVGDPDFGSPPDVREAAKSAIDAGFLSYAPAMGYLDLRQAIADYLGESTGRAFRADEIFIAHGGTGAIYAALAAYLNNQDEILLFDPALSIYTQIAEQIGARSVLVPTTADFHVDLDALERAVNVHSRIVVVVNPGNPSGAVWTRDEMDAVVAFAQRHDLLLVSDETYDHILYDGRRHVSAGEYEDAADRIILLNTVSKTFAMTGSRIGYVAGREELVHGPALIHRASVGPINGIAQREALWAYTHTVRGDWRESMLAEFTRRRDLMMGLVRQTPGLAALRPEGAIYLLVKYAAALPSEEFEQLCLRHGVGVRSGSEFGPSGEGHVRLTFASHPSVYDEGIRRLGAAVADSRLAAM
jgi:aspartate aminotransferase